MQRWVAAMDLPLAVLPSGQWATTPALLDRWISEQVEARQAVWARMVQQAQTGRTDTTLR